VGKLCVAVQGATPAELIARADAALKDSVLSSSVSIILPKPALALPELKAFLTRRRDITSIVTCRRKSFGGKFTGSLNSELDILLKAAQTGCHIVDLEVEAGRAVYPAANWPSSALLSALPARLSLLVRTTLPAHAAPRASIRPPSACRLRTRIRQVVTTARQPRRNLSVLQMSRTRSLTAHVVGIAMARRPHQPGFSACATAAAFTFASAADGAETAPGQVSARTLLDPLPPGTDRPGHSIFGVAGNPLPLPFAAHARHGLPRENVNAIMLPLKGAHT